MTRAESGGWQRWLAFWLASTVSDTRNRLKKQATVTYITNTQGHFLPLRCSSHSAPTPRQCRLTPPLPRASSSHHLHGVVRPIKPRCGLKRSGCGTSAPTPRRMPTRKRSESRRATLRTLTSSSATLSLLSGQRRNSASLSLTTRDGSSQRTTTLCSSRSFPRGTLPFSSALASSQRFVLIFLHSARLASHVQRALRLVGLRANRMNSSTALWRLQDAFTSSF